MKRRTKFIAFFAAAAITLTSLMVFAGPQHFEKNSSCKNWHDHKKNADRHSNDNSRTDSLKQIK